MDKDALVMILHNDKEDTYHPILYLESSSPNNPHNLRRFESSGYHPHGFKERVEAVKSIEHMVPTIKGEVILELKRNIIWDGEEEPVDVQFRETKK